MVRGPTKYGSKEEGPGVLKTPRSQKKPAQGHKRQGAQGRVG